MDSEEKLNSLLEGPIRQKLGIIPKNVTWGGQSNYVFQNLYEDFMQDTIGNIDFLLNHNYQVVVYSGMLDVIVDVLSTLKWMQKLKWPYLKNFLNSPKAAHYTNSTTRETSGFSKKYSNLSFWWILNAGHMAPAENPEMSTLMLQAVLSGKVTNLKDMNEISSKSKLYYP